MNKIVAGSASLSWLLLICGTTTAPANPAPTLGLLVFGAVCVYHIIKEAL